MGDAISSRPVDEIHGAQPDRGNQDPANNMHYGVSPPNMPQANYQYMNQYHQQQSSAARQDSFNMGSLGVALPSYPDYNAPGAQRYHQGSAPSALGYQMQNAQQYSGSPMGLSGASSPYTNAYTTQYQGQYVPAHAPSPQNMQHSVNTTGQIYNNPGFMGQPQQQGQQFFIQQNQYLPQSPVFPVISGGPQFGGRGNFSGDPRLHAQQRGRDFPGAGSTLGNSGRSSSIGECP